MWIVRLALRRPYTFIVASILIVIFGIVSLAKMPTDIFPEINIPLVTVVWQYTGMAPEDMEQRIVSQVERFYNTTVGDIEHIESQSMNGVGVIKIYFQPDANIPTAISEITSASQTAVRNLPLGTQPPIILRFNATDVPIMQIGIESKTLSETQLYDLATNTMRPALSTVQGVSLPLPYGGKSRQVMVDLNPAAMYAKGVSPADVSNAINAENVILPAGTAKFGNREYGVRLNSSPDAIAMLNDLPIKTVNGTTVYIRDVAQVRDGYAVQTNIVRENGRRGVYQGILKTGAASTLAVVQGIKDAIPKAEATLPSSASLKTLMDASLYVRASLNGVVREALIAACLTALMILLFLGSWRSTVVVATSIPLSILVSMICLGALGQTINVMTLGGFALAVGILVDDATVTIENIHRNMAMGKAIVPAILDGAEQIAVPAFVSTLSICIVFMPIFFLGGVAGALFRPLAMAVIFAMLASYLLSRTLVPTMVRYLLAGEVHVYATAAAGGSVHEHGVFWRVNHWFESHFDRLREAYRGVLTQALRRRKAVAISTAVVVLGSCVLVPVIGQDFFPTVDGGQFRVHVRAPSGTRLEVTETLFSRIEDEVRHEIPARDLGLILSNIGLPASSINLATGDNATIGPSDGEMLISLEEGRARSTQEYMKLLRDDFRRKFPGVTFSFQPADIVNQILNLGLAAPIDVQVTGKSRDSNYVITQRIAKAMRGVPGASDVRVQQVMDAPEVLFSVDRTRASELGLTQRDVATSLLISLSSSGQTAPNFWRSPQNGVNYSVAVQTPEYRLSSLNDLETTPIIVPGSAPQLFGNLATPQRVLGMGVVNHYNVQPVFDVYASAQGRDLGGVAHDIDAIINRERAHLPRGTEIFLRGQVASMRSSFLGLGLGLAFAILLVYFLMVVNFQSWLDPFIIIMALPGALTGIVWMLFVTHTTFSVPSLMGAIMAMGVATANSILLVTFANDRRADGLDAIAAALDAGVTRLRPVVMTALAMIIGM
ncbi:MAG TPA: efflux RND transporter permease subunit, partial [Gemmatimonadaceae bacterium]|nr:efflux RND transporter permease subunit [Gemmatimonadaceae bacterium]